jgi:hypothetical protein
VFLSRQSVAVKCKLIASPLEKIID